MPTALIDRAKSSWMACFVSVNGRRQKKLSVKSMSVNAIDRDVNTTIML